MKHVVISILNFNGKENTVDCLESLSKINQAKFKLTVIAVDNASADGFFEEVQSSKFKVQNNNLKLKIIRNEKNLGFSGGHNVVIKYALEIGSDYVLILNNDTYVNKNFLEELLEVGEKDNKIGILTPKIYFAPGFEYYKEKYKKDEFGKVLWYAGGEMDWKNIIGHHTGVDEIDNGQYDTASETEIATGCCMLIKKEVFDKVGIFDDKYFLYYEDADLSMRAKNNGFKIMYVPNSIIWHKNAGSAGGSGSKLQDYYITRNRLIFGTRYAPIRAKLALLKESVKIFLTGRYWQRRGALDFYLGKLGKGSYKI